MRIDKIGIANFKGAKKLVFRPAKVNILLGHNGSGKSSVLQAIRYGLTGAYPPDPISGKSDRAVVELALPDIGTLTRSFSRDKNEVRLNGTATTQKSIAEVFADRYGISAKTSELLTSSEALAQLSGSDLSSYLLGENIIPINVDLPTLLSFCTLSDKAKKALSEAFNPELIQMSDIDRVWNDFKGRRKILKQQHNESKIKSTFKDSVPKRTLEEIDQELMTSSQKQGAMQAEQRSYIQIMNLRNSTLRDIQTKEKVLGEPIEKPNEEKQRQVAADLESVENDLKELNSDLTKIVENGKRLQRILKELANPVCPISKKLKCTTDKTSIRGELTNIIEQERERYRREKAKAEKLDNKRRNMKAWLQEYVKHEQQYQRHSLLLEQIETLRRNLPDEPAAPSKADLDALSEMIQRLNQEKTTVIRYQESLKNKELCAKLAEDLKIYEDIIKELEPKSGIRKNVLTHSLAPLQEFFNSRLSQLLPKYQVQLQCDDGFSIRLLSEDGELDALRSASEGELSRIRFVLMDMINALSPYRILLFDKTDALDAEAIMELIRFLRTEEIQMSYDHIFIALIDYSEVEEVLKDETDFKIVRMSPKKGNSKAA